MKEYLSAPFPYFGGKARVADIVWQALGDVKHYIEPFFGSGAVLLARPDYDPMKHTETVCDKDGMICNVWRALQHDPDTVAKYCDWPVNHADLAARKRKLVEKENYLLEGLMRDPDWYDAMLAGYWIWGASCWIGAGLTSIEQRPDVAKTGEGVHKLSMRTNNLGKRPDVAHTGKAINKISLRENLQSDDVRDPYNSNIYKWFRLLSERLRYVRVVCGDWTRVCRGNWQDCSGTVGMFFDPPYGVDDRSDNLYRHDNKNIARDVLAWVRERGGQKTYRIVVAGYEEYEELLSCGWTAYRWKAQGGYSNLGDNNNNNRFRERLYFSPHCLVVPQQIELWNEMEKE